MLLNWLKRVLIAAVGIGGLATSTALATSIATDSFSYTAPGTLNGQNGGTGFGGAWTAVSGQGNPALASGSMTYSDGSRSLITAGNKLAPGTTQRSSRNFSSTITTANTTLWVSFRINHTGTGTLPTNHAGFQLCDALAGGGTNYIFLGKPGFSATNWGIDRAGTVVQKSGGVSAGDRNAFLVYKLVFTSTQLTASMWVNPVLNEASLGAAHASLTAAHSSNILSILASAGGNASGFEIDELRMGTTFSDIAPFSQLLAYEGFGYTGTLNTQNGGSGFSGAWTAVSGQGNPTLSTGSMAYSDGTKSLLTSGNKLTPGTTQRSSRNFASTISTANSTYWVSFRANHTGTGTLPTNHAGFQFCDALAGGGTNYIFLGKPGFSATNWGMDRNGTVVQKAGGVTTADRDAFLVYKLVFTATQVTVSMWVDPVLNEASLGTAHATLTASHSTNFLSVFVSAGGNASSFHFDEFRMGTTFNDVTPNTTGGGGGTFNPANSAELVTALNNAQLGDTIILNAGTTYTGPFVLPNKTTGSGYITIQSSNLASLPAAGTRTTAAHVGNMPKIQMPDAFHPAMETAVAAHHYKLIGLQVVGPTVDTQPDGISNITWPIIRLGDAGTNQDTLAEVPNNIIIDRCVVRANSATQRLKVGITLNSASTDITNSTVSGIHAVGQDCQALAGYNGPGPFNIINNYLEGSCENVIFGGSDATIPNLIPSDITFMKNYLSKPLSWKQNDPSYAGIHWSVKNIFELKNAQRVLIEGNIFENNWVDGQSGWGIVFTPRNQNGGNPWVILKDITFQKNIVRNTGGYNILGNDDLNPSQTTTNVVIRNNLNYNIDGAFSGNGKLFLISRATDRLTIDHNTSFCTSNVADIGGPGVHTNFVYTNNLSPHNLYGLKGDNTGSGNTAFAMYMPTIVFLRNVLMGGPVSQYNQYTQNWNPTSLGFPSSWTGVLVNQASPGTNFAGWKVVTGSAYDDAGQTVTGASDGKDIGCNIDEVNAATAGCVSGVWP